MELRQLEIYCALAEERHFGRTAARLHIVGFKVAYEMYVEDEDPGVREFAKVMKLGIDNGKSGIGDGEGFYVYAKDGTKTGKTTQFPDIWEQQ